MPALLEAYRAGLLSRKHWLNNIIAGLIVGVVALPLGMAFAIASGVRPEQGIYTSIFAGFLVSIFGGSRLQIAGPTGAFIVILLAIVNEHGVVGLQIATLMGGIILLILGITRMGTIIKYIPAPVIVGFTAGIAVTIWIGQWQNFFKLPAPTADAPFHERLWELLQALPNLHVPTTLLALASLLLIISAPKIPYVKRIPGPLIALVFATVAQSFFNFDGIETIKSTLGSIPTGLPSFTIPERIWDFNFLTALIPPAFAIAMLGAIESLLSAVVADNMASTKHDSNQELIGQGLANIVAPFFGGFAATGAIARTATNIRNGGTSPLSGITHCIVLVLIILYLAPLADNVPLACLAAILFTVAWNMSHAKGFVLMGKRAPRSDVAILIVTFLLTIFVDLIVAVNIGVILAILQFLRRMSSSVEVYAVTQKQLEEEFRNHNVTDSLSDVLVLAVEGPIFFGIAENFERAFYEIYSDPQTVNPHIMIINLKRVPFIDYTGIQAMVQAINRLHKRHVRIILAEANAKVDRKIHRADVLQVVGKENYFKNMLSALIFCQQLSLKSAEADAKAHVETKALADEKKMQEEKMAAQENDNASLKEKNTVEK
ncbi:MAG: SulP family inorganic anion transporter [Saezia sp.]